ncbi:hypothetical protein AUC31_02060 [Planococcus rifietoensis]|uniref:Uncharacterized protein n=1 Tax=Planococcus rifietoensis TaxID=200991 RepID=A0A0U2XDN6_9BACL|nr:hypothetical protein [Planococcus rifietoensis]ALS74112.1 hypothetical protein AUC31_02060 [Planococcus rifietoensis]
MIKNKTAFVGSFIVFAICMYLFFPFPNTAMKEAQFVFMSFPIQDQEGYKLLGIIGSIMFIGAIILLFRSLEKYRFRIVFAVVIVYMFLPNLLIATYQETLANGISAISYDGNGQCNFVTLDDSMDAECNLVLHNRSDEAVTVELEFIDSLFTEEEDMRIESLMNLAGPYSVTLAANSKKHIHLKELIDLSGVPDHIDSGTSFGINLKIKAGNKTRIL